MCYNMREDVTYDEFCTRATEDRNIEGRIAATLRKTVLSKQRNVVSPFAKYFYTSFAFTYI